MTNPQINVTDRNRQPCNVGADVCYTYMSTIQQQSPIDHCGKVETIVGMKCTAAVTAVQLCALVSGHYRFGKARRPPLPDYPEDVHNNFLLHGTTSQTTRTDIFTAIKTLNLNAGIRFLFFFTTNEIYSYILKLARLLTGYKIIWNF